MSTLLFVAISSMSCNMGEVLLKNQVVRRCRFEKEVIVKADALKYLVDQPYLLGPIGTKTSMGCRVTLENGETLIGGKPCRRLMGK